MPVIVDAMGGDHAPGEIVQGALDAARDFDLDVVLVGREAEVRALGLDLDHPRVRLHPAAEVIGMDEHPAQALKKKRDNSISVGMQLALQDPSSSFVSAGSTGAVLAGALFTWKRLPGVERPCIAGILPTLEGSCVVADIGANVDCKASHITHFAVLCAAYSSYMVGVEAPRVALLNIGSEAAKGNEASQLAHAALSELPGIHFLGNIEPEAVYLGGADVVVTDGFPGNIFLKTSEAISNIFHRLLKKGLGANPALATQARPLLAELGRFSTEKSEYAGAPLLGTNGTAIIVHGAARATTIKNAIGCADRAAKSGYLEHLRGIYQAKREAAPGV